MARRAERAVEIEKNKAEQMEKLKKDAAGEAVGGRRDLGGGGGGGGSAGMDEEEVRRHCRRRAGNATGCRRRRRRLHLRAARAAVSCLMHLGLPIAHRYARRLPTASRAVAG